MISTEDKLKDETPHFAKPVLYEVPIYLVGCSIENENRKTKRKKRDGK
jgi:hypothetical protein